MTTPILQHKSPYEVLFNVKPDYTLLRTFGCLCYPYLRSYSPHKLSTRSEQCIFLGYSSFHIGYRCLSLSTNRLYIYRNVIFEESIYPYYPTFTPSHNESSGILGSSPTTSPHSTSIIISHNHEPLTTVPSTEDLSITVPSSTTDSSNSAPITSSPEITDSDEASIAQPSSDLPSPSSTPPLKTKSLTEIYSQTQPVTRHPLPECLLTNINTHCEPLSFSHAIKDSHWLQAMKTEFEALQQNQTWDLVPRSSFMNVINCKWVFKLKHKADGSIERYKARLVAKGFKQEDGFDYNETFSPVIKITTVRILLSLAISQKWFIHQLDVSNAFLHGDLQELIFMEQPPGFENTNLPHHVCQLKKSLYGLKQAPRAWFLKLSNYLLSLGFSASKTDTSLFFQYSNQIAIFLLIYVDDILLISPDSSGIQRLIDSLSSTFSMRDLGSVNFFLGIELIPTPNGYFLSQSKYILSILQKAHMDKAKPTSNPCSFSKFTDSTKFHDPTLYRSIVGALQYLTITRPDISFSVNKACQVMHSPMSSDWTNVKHLLRYLKHTISDGLFYSCNSDISLELFSDADWASCSTDLRSTSGYLVYLGKNLISWRCQKQRTVARSSTEAEYKAVANATAEFIWIKSLLQELRIPLKRSPILWCDNIGATYLAANPVFHARTKHIEIDYHFVREQVKQKNLLIGYLATKDQTADILTKALPKHRFLFLRSKLHLLPILDLRGNVKAYRSPGSNREPVHPTTRFAEVNSRNDRQHISLTWTNRSSSENRNDQIAV